VAKDFENKSRIKKTREKLKYRKLGTQVQRTHKSTGMPGSETHKSSERTKAQSTTKLRWQTPFGTNPANGEKHRSKTKLRWQRAARTKSSERTKVQK
jgi:hypothetical protein